MDSLIKPDVGMRAHSMGGKYQYKVFVLVPMVVFDRVITTVLYKLPGRKGVDIGKISMEANTVNSTDTEL